MAPTQTILMKQKLFLYTKAMEGEIPDNGMPTVLLSIFVKIL